MSTLTASISITESLKAPATNGSISPLCVAFCCQLVAVGAVPTAGFQVPSQQPRSQGNHPPCTTAHGQKNTDCGYLLPVAIDKYAERVYNYVECVQEPASTFCSRRRGRRSWQPPSSTLSDGGTCASWPGTSGLLHRPFNVNSIL